MRRALLALPLLLGALMTACGSSGSTADAPAASPAGGAPALPTGAEVRHPLAPDGAPVYLSLLDDSGALYYQTPVSARATVTAIDPAKWKNAQVGKTVSVQTLVPAGATQVTDSDPAAQVLLLHWVMWKDANSDSVRDAGEVLPLMTHDRVVYADRAVTLGFKTASPDMQQTLMFSKGWNRAAHYVYLPTDTTTFIRTLSTTLLQRYELHEPTPETSF